MRAHHRLDHLLGVGGQARPAPDPRARLPPLRVQTATARFSLRKYVWATRCTSAAVTACTARSMRSASRQEPCPPPPRSGREAAVRGDLAVARGEVAILHLLQLVGAPPAPSAASRSRRRSPSPAPPGCVLPCTSAESRTCPSYLRGSWSRAGAGGDPRSQDQALLQPAGRAVQELFQHVQRRHVPVHVGRRVPAHPHRRVGLGLGVETLLRQGAGISVVIISGAGRGPGAGSRRGTSRPGPAPASGRSRRPGSRSGSAARSRASSTRRPAPW